MAARKPNILVVESDPLNLAALSALLRELKIPFKRNTNGDGVLEQVQQMQPRPDVVLMSLELPENDALAIASALRTDPGLNNVRIVAIGSGKPPSAALEGAGFDGFIATPLPRRQFSALLSRLINGERVFPPPV